MILLSIGDEVRTVMRRFAFTHAIGTRLRALVEVLVVVPLIVSRHHVPAGPKDEENCQRERCDELSAYSSLPELVKWKDGDSRANSMPVAAHRI